MTRTSVRVTSVRVTAALALVLVPALAFAGVAFAQDYSEPPPAATDQSGQEADQSGDQATQAADAGTEAETDEGPGRNVPDCITGGQPGAFGADCQAFVVNQNARPTGWAVLNPDDTHVYRFSFGAYRDPGSDDDPDEESGGLDAVAAERNNVLVLFRSDPQDGASLTFFTADQFRSGDDGFGAATVGVNYLRGDGDDDTPEDATVRNDYASWQGNLSTSGTYYAVVEGTGSQSGPVLYNIQVEGGGVTDFTFANEEPGQAPFEPEDE